MNALIFIIALVFVISIYDYYTSRSWQQVTSTSRNELVFSERNKDYGAYQIRHNYDRNLIVIVFGLALSIALTYGTYVFVKSLPVVEDVLTPFDTTPFTIVAPPVDAIIPPPIDDVIPVRLERTVEFLPPVVTDDQVDNPPPIQDDMTDTRASVNTNDIDIETFTLPITPTIPPIQVQDEILTFVSEEAMFYGGIAEMMKYLGQHIKYPEVAIQAGIQGKVTLRFVVDKDGSIANVSVIRGVPGCPECDKEAVRVVKGMPRWKAARNDGKVVRSYFDLPVTFKLNS